MRRYFTCHAGFMTAVCRLERETGGLEGKEGGGGGRGRGLAPALLGSLRRGISREAENLLLSR